MEFPLPHPLGVLNLRFLPCGQVEVERRIIFVPCVPLTYLFGRPINTFQWIHPNSNPELWQQIQSAFHDELAPDELEPGQDELDVYRYKYLQKVGVVNHSVLVILGL